LDYPTGPAKNPSFADDYLDIYCSDGDKVDVVGTSTIPGAQFYSDYRSVWFYKQNGAMAIMEATQDQGLVNAGHYNKQIQLNTRMVKKSEKNKYRDLIRNGGIATAEIPASVFNNRVKAKADSCKNLEKDRKNMRTSLFARKSDWNTKKANLSGLKETDGALKLAGLERDSSIIAHQSAVDALASLQAANPAPVAGCAEAAEAMSVAKAAMDAAQLAVSVAKAEEAAARVEYTSAMNDGNSTQKANKLAIMNVKVAALNAANNALGPLVTAYEAAQAANLAKVAECSTTDQDAADAKAAMDAAAVIAADAQAAFRAAEQAYTYATVAESNVVVDQKLTIKNNALTT
jgi:hypothetical protein